MVDTSTIPADELDGLITLAEAAEKYGIALDTLRRRVQRTKSPSCLKVRETIKSPGGIQYLVSEADVVASKENPPKRGPQPKS